MATYTHTTPARYTNVGPGYTHSKGGGTYARAATKLISRLRPTSAASNNAKRIFGPDWPGFGGSLGTAFTAVTGVVVRTYRGGITAIGGKSRTR
jgi:hypothetical protein